MAKTKNNEVTSKKVDEKPIIKTKKVGFVNGISKVHEGTLRVSISMVKKHKLYKKRMKSSKNYIVDCPKDATFEMGQEVFIKPIARVSKRKSWQVVM